MSRRPVEPVEDEYSYPPEGRKVISAGELAALGVQLTAPSKRRSETTRVYAEPLSDAAIARIRAHVRRHQGAR